MSPPGPLAEGREGVEAAQGDADVEGVGELRPHAAGRAAVEPEASASRSTSSTSGTPASARWKAMLAPMTPPPMTTTGADAGSAAAVTPAA